MDSGWQIGRSRFRAAQIRPQTPTRLHPGLPQNPSLDICDKQRTAHRRQFRIRNRRAGRTGNAIRPVRSLPTIRPNPATRSPRPHRAAGQAFPSGREPGQQYPQRPRTHLTDQRSGKTDSHPSTRPIRLLQVAKRRTDQTAAKTTLISAGPRPQPLKVRSRRASVSMRLYRPILRVLT